VINIYISSGMEEEKAALMIMEEELDFKKCP
jgi:hypothetical protein